MSNVIFVDADKQLQSKSIKSKDEFDKFFASLSPEQVLWFNDETFEANVPDEHKEVFPIFLKSMKRRWTYSHSLLIPDQKVHVVEEEGILLTITDKEVKPKRKRKPKKDV